MMAINNTNNESTRISTFTSLPLGELLGAPLLALVQGQAQAAQATAEFIEQIGFEAENATDGTLGDLRMVSFFYEKLVAGSDLAQKVQVSVPLLSLITVPNIQVKKALLEYAVKVSEIRALDASAKNVALQSTPSILNETTQTNLQMKITINAGQAPLPAGIEFLENIMEQSVQQQ